MSQHEKPEYAEPRAAGGWLPILTLVVVAGAVGVWLADLSLHLKLLAGLFVLALAAIVLTAHRAGTNPRRRRALFRLWLFVPVLLLGAESFFSFKDWRLARATAALRAGKEDDPDSMFYRSLVCNYRLKPSRTYQLWGATVAIDRNGFRSTYDVSKEREPGVVRIMVLGGSTTFGYGVPDGQDVAAHMRTLLNKENQAPRFEIINASVAYYTSFQEANAYLHVLSHYDPDVLIVLHGRNDLRHAAQTGHDWRPAEEEQVGHLPFWEPKVSLYESLPMRSALYRRIYRRVDLVINPPAVKNKDYVDPRCAEQFKAHRELIAAEAQRRGTLCVLALQPIIHAGRNLTPNEEQLKHMFGGYGELMGLHWEAFQQASAETGAPEAVVADLTDLFADFEGEAYLDECHYTAAGNRRVAQALVELLEPNLGRLTGGG